MPAYNFLYRPYARNARERDAPAKILPGTPDGRMPALPGICADSGGGRRLRHAYSVPAAVLHTPAGRVSRGRKVAPGGAGRPAPSRTLAPAQAVRPLPAPAASRTATKVAKGVENAVVHPSCPGRQSHLYTDNADNHITGKDPALCRARSVPRGEPYGCAFK